jgi:hypothetical protein
MEGSNKFSLNATDWRKVFVGLLVALAGAGAAWLTEQLPGVDLGNYSLIAAAVGATLANLLRKFVADNSGGA